MVTRTVIAIPSKTVCHPVETRTGKHALGRHMRPSVAQDLAECDDELEKRHVLGQFLTPDPMADFMASLFKAHLHSIKLLDAGAGAGALSAALVRKICSAQHQPKEISVTAYELDPSLLSVLRENYARCQALCEQAGIRFSATVHNTDFIEAVTPMVRGELFAPQAPKFNLSIVNPPYRKIRSDSATRLFLRSAGIETSNLYTAFLSLIIRLLSDDGELIAITPRSFCNGPYFKPFREDFLAQMSLRRLHEFESRSAAFSGDDVLQENIIFHAVKSRQRPSQVIISSSSGEANAKVSQRQVEYHDVVSPSDPDQFIHLVADDAQAKVRHTMQQLGTSLPDLGLTVSTGRVVDFRARDFLRQQPERGTVPLIYPCHFNGGFVNWPKPNGRKPNAIVDDEQTRDLLVPAGIYVLVKRFSSKEERRRVVACIYDSSRIQAPWVGFENHLNYFHANGAGLPDVLAKGLAAFLNSTLVDAFFRQFNGHTQVNATDLRSLHYPTKKQLLQLGREVGAHGLEQAQLDLLVERVLDVAS